MPESNVVVGVVVGVRVTEVAEYNQLQGHLWPVI
jgi:hypothetical protein